MQTNHNKFELTKRVEKRTSIALCQLTAQKVLGHQISRTRATFPTIRGFNHRSQIQRNARVDCHLSSHPRWTLQPAWPQLGNSIPSSTSMTITTNSLYSRSRSPWSAGLGRLSPCRESATTQVRIRLHRSSPQRSKISRSTHAKSTLPTI